MMHVKAAGKQASAALCPCNLYPCGLLLRRSPRPSRRSCAARLQVTFPFAVVEAGISLSHVVAAPLAAVCLSLDGVGGMAGWRWLFVVEGLPTLLLAGEQRCQRGGGGQQGRRNLGWSWLFAVQGGLRWLALCLSVLSASDVPTRPHPCRLAPAPPGAMCRLPAPAPTTTRHHVPPAAGQPRAVQVPHSHGAQGAHA